MTVPLQLPVHRMRTTLQALKLKCNDADWYNSNKDRVRAIVERAKEPLYQFEPYFNRSNGEPSWQWQFLMNANMKGRVALGANRIGKSEIGAYESVLAVTGLHPVREYPESGIGWVVGLDNPMLRDIDRPMFERYLPERFKTKFYKQDNIWTCRGDGRDWEVRFKSAEMGTEKFQGAKIDFIWYDEEPKKIDIFNEASARLVDRGGNWFMTATPVRGTAWLKALSERDDVFTTFAGMRENPYLPIEEVEKFAATLPEDERDTRIEGLYVIFGGNPVFNRKILRKIKAELDVCGFEGVLEEVA